jgi:putative mRNA 3-end processing factor
VTTVRHTDGIEIELSDGRVVHADAGRPSGDLDVLSHAHGDHLYDDSPGALICSELTAALAGVRRDEPPDVTTHPDVKLLNAGHVPGSRAALITDRSSARDDPVRILYTGDVSTRDRFYLQGFDPGPVSADVLITEATYGTPEYVFPPQSELEATIVDWFEDTADRPVICMGYSLGRAQEILRLAARAGRSRLLVSDAIARLNAVIESYLDVSFGSQRYDSDVDLRPGDVLVLPGQTNHLSFVGRLRDDADALKAGFSGWALDSGFKYRGDYDETFVLSDHCDHDELVELVRTVDPERVYVQHGAADEFAAYLTRETPYEAQSLQRNQTSLDEF